MANEQNLKPLNTRSKSDQRRIQKMGLDAARKKRSWQAEQREKLRTLLNMKMTPELLKKFADNGVNLDEGADFSDGINAGMIVAAIAGNDRAFKVLKDYSGTSNKTEAEEKRIEAEAKAAAGDEIQTADDGFLDALKGTAAADWAAGGDA